MLEPAVYYIVVDVLGVLVVAQVPMHHHLHEEESNFRRKDLDTPCDDSERMQLEYFYQTILLFFHLLIPAKMRMQCQTQRMAKA